MNCKWQELTVTDFVKVSKEVQGTCLVPLGVLEKHGEHLPLGTDALNVQAIAERAVALEPALLFPTHYFGQINEARHWPGTIAVKREILLGLLENVCDEIARNGLKRIVLLNGHGGNGDFLSFFLFSLLQQPRDYVVYVIGLGQYNSPAAADPQFKAMLQSPFDHHAGEVETSLTLANYPDLVKMQYLAKPANPLNRAEHLRGVRTPMWWYADYPDHYAGDAAHASADKGRSFLDRCVREVADRLKAIKQDAITPQLQQEYFSRCRH